VAVVIIHHNQREALEEALSTMAKRLPASVVVVERDCQESELIGSGIKKYVNVLERFVFDETMSEAGIVNRLAVFLIKSNYRYVWTVGTGARLNDHCFAGLHRNIEQQVDAAGNEVLGQLVNLITFARLGGYEEKYFAGFAGFDYCFRVRLSGGKLGGPILPFPKRERTIMQAYFAGRNPWLFWKLRQPTANLYDCAAAFLYTLGFSKSWRLIKAYWSGFWDGWRLLQF
jgi:hypothetical protein